MIKQLQNLILIALFLCSASIIAQPSLTASNMNPSAGEMFTYYSSTNTASPGNAGANQTWNLTVLSSTASATSAFVSAASTPSGSSFPLATLSGTTSGSSNYSYFTPGSTGYYNYGQVVNGVVMSYSDPETILSYPFNYNNTNTDGWACTFTNGSQIVRTGSTTITADGYGTLITPAGTYSNVMRVHFVQAYKDSSMGVIIFNYVNDEYMWYQPGIHQVLAYTYTFTINGSTGGNLGGYMATTPTGLNNFSPQIESLSLFPNPSTEAVTLSFNGTEAVMAEIQVCSVTGQKLKSISGIEISPGKNNVKVSTDDLPEGIYFMQIYVDGILSKNERFIVGK